MGIFQALAKTITTGATIAAEEAAYQEAAPARSAEFWRTVRAVKAQAADSMQRGGLEAGKLRTAGSLMSGTQTVASVVNGVDSSTGSAAQVQESSAMLAELDAQTTMANARREALGFKRTEQKLYAEAKQEALAHKAKNNADVVRIFGSFLDLGAAAADGVKPGGK